MEPFAGWVDPLEAQKSNLKDNWFPIGVISGISNEP